jgi:hypothetical protein
MRWNPPDLPISLFLFSSLSTLSSCAAPKAAAKAPGNDVVVSHVTPPAGTALLQACTPTGPELCFNAIDDNCNGVIDEGCGEKTGLLQFTIAWAASTADVNLTVVTPAQERVPNGQARSTASGFESDRDCPGPDGCRGQNIENIYFDGAEPPRGHYVAEITLVDLHGTDPPVQVRFGARLGGRTVGFAVDLAPGDDAKKTFSFDLP